MNPMYDSPMPHDFESALIEIVSLRKRLEEANKKWCKAVLLKENASRAHSGDVLKLKEEITELKAQRTTDKQLLTWNEEDTDYHY